MNRQRAQSGVRKRSSTACKRCRQQKVKCSGVFPCEPCTKRKLTCTFDDTTQKILVTRGFIDDLQRRANVVEPSGFDASPILQDHGPAPFHSVYPVTALRENDGGSVASQAVSNWLQRVEDNRQQPPPEQVANAANNGDTDRRSSSPSVELMNPFAIDAANYIEDNRGRAFYLGTSSNWSFGRRVLSMTCDRLRLQLPLESLHFEGAVYQFDWNILKAAPRTSGQSLPSPDYASYLINAVKFHCGQIFHLFDEDIFMQHFKRFHEDPDGVTKVPQLWYVHYLLIIAFGKAFTARNTKDNRPAGTDLVLEVLRRLPEITFEEHDVFESLEILCCAALYLQCLDFRSHAYNLIGQALRKCLEHGFHTGMRSSNLPENAMQRCRRIWWTVYILDRQMSSLMGVPMAVRDEDLSAPLPSSADSSQTPLALDLHVKLSRVIAQILNTVYSTEGRLDKKFLTSTKTALKNIASVTNQLNSSFEMPDHVAMAGISRLSAYLHLLHHQCICLATRPLAYTFLERRLRNTANERYRFRPTGSVRVLLRVCIESAQQMLNILEGLQNQNLLESFLPFDLESVFVSIIVLIMISTIDGSLIEGYESWIEKGYSILDEMASRGNAVAHLRKRELEHLGGILGQVPPLVRPSGPRTNVNILQEETPRDSGKGGLAFGATNGWESMPSVTARDDQLFQPFGGQDEFTAEQLMLIADSLDLDGLDWMTTSWGDTSSQINT